MCSLEPRIPVQTGFRGGSAGSYRHCFTVQAGVPTTRIAKKNYPLEKHYPATKMLVRAVGYSPTKKKILLKGKTGR